MAEVDEASKGWLWQRWVQHGGIWVVAEVGSVYFDLIFFLWVIFWIWNLLLV